MSAKYTSCRWFDCMDRSFELPAQTSCVGQYYEPYPYCGIYNPLPPADVRTVVGGCDLAVNLGKCEYYTPVSDWDRECGGGLTLGSDGVCHSGINCHLGYEVYEDP